MHFIFAINVRNNYGFKLTHTRHQKKLKWKTKRSIIQLQICDFCNNTAKCCNNILRSAAAVGESPRSATSAMMTSCVEFRQHDATQYFRISVYINLYWALAATVPVTDDLWPLTPACLTAKRTISDADRIQSGQSSVKFCPAPSLPTVVPDSSTPFRLFHAHLI